mgnify:FL=1
MNAVGDKSFKDVLGRMFALFAILISGFAIIKWKEYEANAIAKLRDVPKDTVTVDIDSPTEMEKRINILENMATIEREKIKVMVEHDNSPFTSTYPMILDATKSFDPDVGDELEFVWKQIEGKKVDLKPNPFANKVSFEGEAGEYTFELRVTDNYGSETIATKTVIIEPEPNAAPVIDLSIRQGSELN